MTHFCFKLLDLSSIIINECVNCGWPRYKWLQLEKFGPLFIQVVPLCLGKSRKPDYVCYELSLHNKM